MKFSRLGLIFLLGVMGSAFAPLALESNLFSVSSVVAQTNQERKEEANNLSECLRRPALLVLGRRF